MFAQNVLHRKRSHSLLIWRAWNNSIRCQHREMHLVADRGLLGSYSFRRPQNCFIQFRCQAVHACLSWVMLFCWKEYLGEYCCGSFFSKHHMFLCIRSPTYSRKRISVALLLSNIPWKWYFRNVFPQSVENHAHYLKHQAFHLLLKGVHWAGVIIDA